MECSVKDCEWSGDCVIREITNKEPPKEGCSYLRRRKNKHKDKMNASGG